jgi:hypothetical protein
VKLSTAPPSAPFASVRSAQNESIGGVVDRIIDKLRLPETPDRIILRKRHGTHGMQLGPPLDAAMQVAELNHRDHLVVETIGELSTDLFELPLDQVFVRSHFVFVFKMDFKLHATLWASQPDTGRCEAIHQIVSCMALIVSWQGIPPAFVAVQLPPPSSQILLSLTLSKRRRLPLRLLTQPYDCR